MTTQLHAERPSGETASHVPPAYTTIQAPPAPSAPRDLAATGIRRSLLEELALKVIDVEGEILLRDLAVRLGLAPPLVDELFQRLRKAQMIEVTGMVAGQHRVAVVGAGRARAQDLLARNRYAGVAPVSLDDYGERVRAQGGRQRATTAQDVHRALSPLVLEEEMLRQLGIAIVSGTSLVLHGPTGTGKTAIAELIPDVHHETAVWIPHAVEVDGQIITIYDPHVHERVELPASGGSIFADDQPDARWVLCRRPRVMAGGELTLDMLDLQYNPGTGYYSAPLQMKANNGVFVMDDFGRQRTRPEELLNRWIVPLDRGVDYLTLQGGKKFEIPFTLLVVFSTNLDPASGFRAAGTGGATDDAFLRRIPNKIAVGFASERQFHAIFERVCADAGVACDAATVDRLIHHLRGALGQPLRPCYPRDLVRQLSWEASYDGRPAELTWDALLRACGSYFLEAREAAAPA